VIRVLVTNTKGGCGKTTIATNLATAFAAGGLGTALADVDRQKSSLDWLAARPADAAPIRGLDWRKAAGEVPKGVQRLVIDCPAALTRGEVEDLIREADIVVVPVLPSVFDEGSTRRFLERLEELKPVRKGRKSVAIVANRLRPRSRAVGRLETFLAGLGRPVAARLTDRSLYADLATKGQGLFDLDGAKVRAVRAEWQPLLGAIEGVAG
jgi:chromosome partitioning protein